jgi:hypothetical protein
MSADVDALVQELGLLLGEVNADGASGAVPNLVWHAVVGDPLHPGEFWLTVWFSCDFCGAEWDEPVLLDLLPISGAGEQVAGILEDSFTHCYECAP